MKDVLFLQLNEINFDLASRYRDKLKLEGFKKVFSLDYIETNSEENYDLLEPWIQWPSIHTGLSAKEHKIFRLGDVIFSDKENIFKFAENLNYKVGVISAMNLKNDLKKASFFIPDPWTKTSSGNTFWEKIITSFVKQSVNDNSSNKITLKSYFFIFLTFLRFFDFKNLYTYLQLALLSKGRPWRKALFLDLLLSDVFFKLRKNYETNFSTLFLNAGAHIQHHYLYNSTFNENYNKNPEWYVSSSFDPIEEMFSIYDRIIQKALRSISDKIIIATAISQEFDEKSIFYYRPKNHESFLTSLSIKFKKVYPRMTRDFLIEFDSEKDADVALEKLNKIYLNKEKLFFYPEKREKSLFVTLGYRKEIKKDDSILVGSKKINMFRNLSFVALKNGKHSSKGYLFLSKNMAEIPLNKNLNVKDIFSILKNYLT